MHIQVYNQRAATLINIERVRIIYMHTHLCAHRPTHAAVRVLGPHTAESAQGTSMCEYTARFFAKSMMEPSRCATDSFAQRRCVSVHHSTANSW